jgi:hypothetical protein
MTAQFSEILHYKGEKLSMRVTPLSDYFVLRGMRPDFQDISTACWRCYVGEWDITLDRLYLIGIRADYKDGTEVTLGRLFPGYDSRVFAHWYSGVLSIPQGDLVEYVHMGYASVYERDLLLSVEQGVIVDSQVRVNGESSSAQESRA